jgi:V8-like Glu-specific endopeptidase
VLSAAVRGEIRFETTRPGYSPLGAILTQMLEEGDIGDEAVRFIASTIISYNLVDLMTAKVTSKMKALFSLTTAQDNTPGLERIIRRVDNYLDSKWLHDANKAMRTVCRVEIEDKSGVNTGTGFLVGQNTIMTCAYMIAAVSDDSIGAPQANMVFRFGYGVDRDGLVDVGQTYRLAAKDWLVASSPVTELDFVMLRVEGMPGLDLVGGEPRSWLIPQAHTFLRGEQLFIIEHPPGGPAKVSISSNAVLEANPGTGRLIYRGATEPGSSGAPCFTNNWELVAMNEASSQSIQQGITMSAILDQPKVRAALDT